MSGNSNWLLQQLAEICRENYAKWPDSPYGQSALDNDDRAARHNGARITDIVKRCEGTRYDAGTPVYRRYRTALEAAVRSGEAIAWRPGASAYVFYWPVGLSSDLRRAAAEPQP